MSTPDGPSESLDLFGAPIAQPEARTAAGGGKAQASGAKRPKWSKYRAVESFKCDLCVKAMIDGGPWRAPNRATHIREWNGERAYLCYPHTQEQRVKDGLKPDPR